MRLFGLSFRIVSDILYKERASCHHDRRMTSHFVAYLKENHNSTISIHNFFFLQICNLLHFTATLLFCRFKFCILLIQLKGHTVVYQFSIKRLHLIWIRMLEFIRLELCNAAKCDTYSLELVLPVTQISKYMLRLCLKILAREFTRVWKKASDSL